MQKPSLATRHKRFESVVMPIVPDLQRFVQAMTRDTETTKDIISETFYRAYKYFDTLNETSAVKSWLFTIARRVFYDVVQTQKQTTTLSEDVESEIVDFDPLPDRKAELHLLHQALTKLPDKQREALLLFDVFGFSLNEIQIMQQDSLSAVKQRLKRGREKLSQLLGADAIVE